MRLGGDLLWRDLRVKRFAQAKPALFLDRDGVIVQEIGYLANPDHVELLSGIPELIAAAKARGMAVVEVTNQAGIGHGYFGWSDFVLVEDRLSQLLAEKRAAVDAVFACPFHPRGNPPYDHPNHPWRKPNPGMLLEAARLLHLDLEASVMVGDKELDQMTAKAADLRYGIHLRTGYGSETEAAARRIASERFPVYVFDDAFQATQWILENPVVPPVRTS